MIFPKASIWALLLLTLVGCAPVVQSIPPNTSTWVVEYEDVAKREQRTIEQASESQLVAAEFWVARADAMAAATWRMYHQKGAAITSEFLCRELLETKKKRLLVVMGCIDLLDFRPDFRSSRRSTPELDRHYSHWAKLRGRISDDLLAISQRDPAALSEIYRISVASDLYRGGTTQDVWRDLLAISSSRDEDVRSAWQLWFTMLAYGMHQEHFAHRLNPQNILARSSQLLVWLEQSSTNWTFRAANSTPDYAEFDGTLPLSGDLGILWVETEVTIPSASSLRSYFLGSADHFLRVIGP